MEIDDDSPLEINNDGDGSVNSLSPDIKKTVKKGDIVPFRRPPKRVKSS